MEPNHFWWKLPRFGELLKICPAACLSTAHWADLGVQVAWIHYLASIHVNLYPLAAQSAVLGYWEAGRWFGRDAVIPMIILPTPNYYCFITFGKRMSNLQSRYNRDCEYLICCHISSSPPPLSSLTSVVRPAGLEYSWLSGAASCNTHNHQPSALVG